jgi:hypothetical protein
MNEMDGMEFGMFQGKPAAVDSWKWKWNRENLISALEEEPVPVPAHAPENSKCYGGATVLPL